MTADFDAALTSWSHWASVGITLALTIVCVVLHYEVLERLNRRMPHWQIRRHVRILVMIVWILGLHVAEIWLFGLAMYHSIAIPGLGDIHGAEPFKLLDAIYFSATTYTTAGYGDLVPVGPVQLLVGMESLMGLVLITWSASFTYLEMQRFWRS